MKRILIVEDDHGSLLLLKIYLKKIFDPIEKIEFVPIDNGEEAIEIFKKDQENISLVFMDVRLNCSMSGYETAREILKIKYVPIIMITAQNMDREKELSIRSGCIEHISKPYSVKDLQRILTNLKMISSN